MHRIITDYVTDIRLITRNNILFLLGGLLMGLLMSFMHLLLNLYLKDIGYGETFIGQVLSSLAIGGVVAALPSAYLVARFRIKPVLILAAVVSSAAFYLLASTQISILLMGAAFTIGMMNTIRQVAAAPFIMRNSTETERTLLFSLNFSTWMIAGIIGSYGGGYLRDYLFQAIGDAARAYQYTLIAAALLGLLAIIPFAMIRARPPSPDEVKKVFSLKALRQKGPLFFKLTLPYFLLGAGAGLIIPFLNLYFRNRFELSPTRIGFYFSIMQFTMLGAVLIVPILKRQFGFIRTVVLTELASVPFMLILCFTENLALAFWAFLFRGALMNMGQPVGTTFMMEAVKPEDHGLINSLSSMAWTSSWAVSTQVGGAMIEHSGFVPVFLIAIGLYLASSITYYYFFSGTEVSETARVRIDVSRVR